MNKLIIGFLLGCAWTYYILPSPTPALDPYEGGVLIDFAEPDSNGGRTETLLADSALVTFDPPSMVVWADGDTLGVNTEHYEEIFLR